jgi:hypothetical protein
MLMNRKWRRVGSSTDTCISTPKMMPSCLRAEQKKASKTTAAAACQHQQLHQHNKHNAQLPKRRNTEREARKQQQPWRQGHIHYNTVVPNLEHNAKDIAGSSAST